MTNKIKLFVKSGGINMAMTKSQILLAAAKILKEVCTEDAKCSECPIEETCRKCEEMPHQFIKNLHYDLFIKPNF